MALQIHRRIGGAAGAPPSLEDGQLAYNNNGHTLFVGDGAVQTLISPTRQVELAGAQTITGAKTIDIANLHVTGGADGDQLVTDGAGGLTWEPLPAVSADNVTLSAIAGLTATDVQAALAEIITGGAIAVAVDGVTIGGDGTTADPLECIGLDDGTW